MNASWRSHLSRRSALHSLRRAKPFIFTAEVAVKPEVTLGEYKGLKVDKVSTRVTQKEIDEEIDKERERNARTIDVTDRAVQGQGSDRAGF